MTMNNHANRERKNPVPRLGGNFFQGATTKEYELSII